MVLNDFKDYDERHPKKDLIDNVETIEKFENFEKDNESFPQHQIIYLNNDNKEKSILNDFLFGKGNETSWMNDMSTIPNLFNSNISKGDDCQLFLPDGDEEHILNESMLKGWHSSNALKSNEIIPQEKEKINLEESQVGILSYLDKKYDNEQNNNYLVMNYYLDELIKLY